MIVGGAAPLTHAERLQRARRRRPSSAEEENLLLEVLEDSRLRGIGIDPDGDSVDIMVELMRRLEILEAESRSPELFVRGKETYRANLNAENPIGTMQSIEHALRALDRLAEEECAETQRKEKALADYTTQMDKAFEHEQRLKELLAKQAQLNAALDLDKNEHQV